MDWITEPHAWVALTTLTGLELVLGIDNIIFISILASKLPAAQRERARRLGLFGAMFMRIALLASIAWVMRLTTPLFTMLENEISGRDMIMLVGGLFLIAKATYEIHDKLEGEQHGHAGTTPSDFAATVVQIMILDIVFSLDSVITAIGMAEALGIMIAAVVLAVILMMFFARPVGEFVERHPTVTVLALSFLLLIGMALIADGLDRHIPKGYIYFAFAFSVFVEMLNLRLRGVATPPVRLHDRYVWETDDPKDGAGT